MTRKKKLLLNTLMGIAKPVITLICGFILPRFFLVHYGSAINGLVSSITHFLSFISLLDMGVGAVVQANLYKPLADRDTEQISLVVKSSKKFFHRLAYIFVVYIIVLSVLFPTVLSTEYDAWYTVSLLIIISISSLAQYMFGMTYQLLLNADQRSYIQLGLQIGTIILNTVLAVIMMEMGASIHSVKLMTATVYVLRPFGQYLYVKRHYDIDNSVELVGEPIKQKWNGFSQHVAAVVCKNIDVVVLTSFSTLENVSIYTVYHMVTSGVEQIVMTAASGLEALFGNMIAKNETEQLNKTFEAVEWGIHTIVVIIFTIAAITIVPFVFVYTRGITDADYIKPLFGTLLVAAYGVECLRIPYFRVIKAAGHFKETQNGAYISALLNIVVTVLLVFKYDLIGAAIGTLVAMLYHTVYFAWYLRKSILNRPIIKFLKYIFTDCLVVIASCFAAKLFPINAGNYLQWGIAALKTTLAVCISSAVINLIFYRKQLFAAKSLISKKK